MATAKTPEEIETMRQTVQAYDADQRAKAQKARADAAKPLVDLVASDGFKAVVAAMPAIDALAVNAKDFPQLRSAYAALAAGVESFKSIAAPYAPGAATPDAATPAAAKAS